MDWKSSAHTGELQVREFAREERSTVSVYFDARGPAGEEFERSVESCAFVVWMLSGESVRVRFQSQRVDLFFPDQVDIYAILRALAVIEPVADGEIPAIDEEERHLLFTSAPETWENAGWKPGRVVREGQVRADV